MKMILLLMMTMVVMIVMIKCLATLTWASDSPSTVRVGDLTSSRDENV